MHLSTSVFCNQVNFKHVDFDKHIFRMRFCSALYHLQVATDRLVLEDEVEAPAGKDISASGNLEFPMQRSLEERYLEVMKQLQFGMYTYVYIYDE
jgi:hypothetical protein